MQNPAKTNVLFAQCFVILRMKLPIFCLPASPARISWKKPCNGAPFLFYLVSAPLCFANVHLIFIFKTRLGQQTLDNLPQWFVRAEVTGFESSGNIPQLNMKREIQCSVERANSPKSQVAHPLHSGKTAYILWWPQQPFLQTRVGWPNVCMRVFAHRHSHCWSEKLRWTAPTSNILGQ